MLFVHDTGRDRRNTLLLHGWCRLEATVEGLKLVCMLSVLNVRQRKLGTIIIQTVHILQHDSAVTGSLPNGEFLHGQPKYFQLT